MDDEAVSTFGDDAAGVGILTTLASSRRGRTAPAKIEGLPVKKNVWQMRALVGLMSVGVISLLAGFVMVLMDGHGPDGKPAGDAIANGQPLQQARAQGADKTATPAAQPSADNPLAALIAPPQHGGFAPPAGQAAVIENVIATPATPPVSATQTAPTAQAAPAEARVITATAPVVPPASVTHAVTPSVTTAERPSPSATTAATTAAAPHANATGTQVALTAPRSDAAKPVAKPLANSAAAHNTATGSVAKDSAVTATLMSPTPPAPSKRSAGNGRQDDDVALLEAMFAHTRTRPAAPAAGHSAAPSPSVADELKHCATLGGAIAATCRARVCVQSPTAAACHQDP